MTGPSKQEKFRRSLDLWATTIAYYVGFGVIIAEMIVDKFRNPTAFIVGFGLASGAKVLSSLRSLADKETTDRLDEIQRMTDEQAAAERARQHPDVTPLSEHRERKENHE